MEHNLEKRENSVGNGGLLPVNHHCPPTAGPGVGEELLPGNGADVKGGEEKSEGDFELEEGEGGDGESDDDDDDDDDDEVEYDNEDMFFDQDFEPVSPGRLHRNNSTKEPMVPYGSKDAEQALQHFVQVFEERYDKKHPHFYIGSLENAMKEVVSNIKDPDQLKPLLIFIHSDHSIMAHVFCSEVLCNQVIIDYLNRNYITWPWDITQPENKETLLYMVEHCFTKEDKSFQIVHQWFKPSQEPRLDGWKAKTALRELVSRKDDLPACLIFYPINNCPHAIEEAWLTSIVTGDMTESFLEVLVSSIENYEVLLQESKSFKEDEDNLFESQRESTEEEQDRAGSDQFHVNTDSSKE